MPMKSENNNCADRDVNNESPIPLLKQLGDKEH